MDRDRFGNPFAPSLSYARGKILSSTEDDFRKLQQAWRLMREHGPESIFIFTGLEHGLPMKRGPALRGRRDRAGDLV
jgi:hypothetical protein